MERFKGKTAFITGGSKGIGRAIALRLASEGCNIAIGFLKNRDDAKATAQAVEEQGVRCLTLRGNIGNGEHLARMFAKIETEMGGLDFFVSNAATGVLKSAVEVSSDDWDLSMNSNAKSLLLGAQSAVPLMEKRGGGKIVAVTSIGSVRCLSQYAAVGASKAALESIVRYLAIELAEKNINVNAVSPGITDTFSLSLFPNRDEIVSKALEYTPRKRLTLPEDVASVVAFLLSDDANWIVGATIVCDGGLSLIA